MMQRVFKGVLKTDEDLVLKYKDEDGDLVSLVDTNDLTYAIQYSRVLRLTISQQNADNIDGDGIFDKEVVKELRIIRDRVNHLLDMVVSDKKNEKDSGVGESFEKTVEETVTGVNNINLEQSKEFDPLQDQEQEIQVQEKSRQMSGQSSASSQGQQQPPPSQYQQQAGYPSYSPAAASNYPSSTPVYPGAPPASAGGYPNSTHTTTITSNQQSSSSQAYSSTGPTSHYPGANPTSTPSFQGGPPSSSYPGAPPSSTPSYPGGPPSTGPGGPSGYPAAPGGPPSTGPSSGYPAAPGGPPTSTPGYAGATPSTYQQSSQSQTPSYPGPAPPSNY